MNIAITSTNYVESSICGIVDGLLQLGHKVYNLNGPAINYAESWPIPSPSKIDIWFMLDTDNSIALALSPDKMGLPLRGAKKIICHLHDRFTDYINVPSSPIKPVPVDSMKGDTLFVRDLDVATKDKCAKKGLPVYALDYTIERRYTESCVQHLNKERRMELLFLGTLSTAHRQLYLDTVRNAGLPVRYGTYEYNDGDGKWSKWIYGRYTHDPRYYEELCKYMFSFCPAGAGWTCFRHAESYAAGCIPVIQRCSSEIIPYHSFIDGVNCILWGDAEELKGKLDYWVNRPEESKQLQKECYDYGQKYMTSVILAQYILDRF
jgi:hypothetical protein